MPLPTPRSAVIVNALLRCNGRDLKLRPPFELVRDDLDLWVMELECQSSDRWDSQIACLVDQIEDNRAILASLSNDNSGFTLHLAVETDETLPLRIPAKLTDLAHAFGFEIEIYAQL